MLCTLYFLECIYSHPQCIIKKEKNLISLHHQDWNHRPLNFHPSAKLGVHSGGMDFQYTCSYLAIASAWLYNKFSNNNITNISSYTKNDAKSYHACDLVCCIKKIDSASVILFAMIMMIFLLNIEKTCEHCFLKTSHHLSFLPELQ